MEVGKWKCFFFRFCHRQLLFFPAIGCAEVGIGSSTTTGAFADAYNFFLAMRSTSSAFPAITFLGMARVDSSCPPWGSEKCFLLRGRNLMWSDGHYDAAAPTMDEKCGSLWRVVFAL